MPVFSIGRVNGLLALVTTPLPARVQSMGDFEDWNVASLAMLAIAAEFLEGLAGAVPPRGRLRAEVFARSLAEYVITFAWAAAAEGDEREQRMRSLLKDEYLEREKSERKLADQIGVRPAYAHLFESEEGEGRLPRTLLNDENRARLEALKANASIGRPPNALEMAFVADRRWMPEIDLVDHNPFALVYWVLFTGSSFVTHPSSTALSRMVMGNAPNLLVGKAVPLEASESPYGQSVAAFVNMLLVASRSIGWPDEASVRRIIDA